VAAGIATKSAQVPFHIWLPAAMAGPTPVSSFLHSATMVKAGVFLLARLTPTLGDNALWNTTFTVMGAVTMLVGALLSASQRDIKKILAFSTIAVLGILVMLLGIGTHVSITAAVVFLVAHALYKAALFQIIGNIDYATGNRDLHTLGSLASYMPLTAAAAVLSVLSMAGAPPLFGFFGKELAYLAKIQLEGAGLVLLACAVFTNVLLVGLAFSICYRPFWSRLKTESSIKPVPKLMSLVPLTFSITGLLIGVFPAIFDGFLGLPMASAIAGEPLTVKLKLWHGFNFESLLVLGLSFTTLAIGIVAAFKVQQVIAFLSGMLSKVAARGPDAGYERVMAAIPVWATRLTESIQHGDLSRYITWTLLSALALVIAPLFWVGQTVQMAVSLDVIDVIIMAFIAVPAVCAVGKGGAITRLVYLGASGFGIVMYFGVFGAPDLALTQLLVEALVLIFVVALLRSARQSATLRCDRPTGLAILAAAGMGSVFFLLKSSGLPEIVNETKAFFLNTSFAQAFGQNVVNVILVDFRALDTFGEVVVVSIAALGVGALLIERGRRGQDG
jgi:multicomponent Na+:H+ antiporter subunit A